ncbi:MAG: ATP-dependent Clp protease ATP-binding subunit [Myxococcota bacterium]|nr:ATP-dependent Clp protease ATP-binding subunit [Myxococcota bacterium]
MKPPWFVEWLAAVQVRAEACGRAPTSVDLALWLLREGRESGRTLREAGLDEGRLEPFAVQPEPAAVLARLLERTMKVARARGEAADERHALFACVRDGRSALALAARHAGIRPEQLAALLLPPLRDGVARPAGAATSRPLAATAPGPPRASGAQRVAERATRPLAAGAPTIGDPLPRAASALDAERMPLLCAHGRDLTQAARDGRLDPVVGRERELEALLDVLGRRHARHPLIVGPPGVGKTALVHALARRLADEDPGRTVVEVAAASLVPGTAVRGALAERVRALCAEVERAAGRNVLVLDRLHAWLVPEAGDEATGELRAALERGLGGATCIGVVSEVHARDRLQRDPSIARWMTPVHVHELDPDTCRGIVEALAPRYAAHHGVAYERAALERAVHWSVRYLTEGVMPERVLGILDVAGARARRRGESRVEVQAVAAVVAEHARLPVDRVLETDCERLARLEERLARRVVGHTGVLARIADLCRKGAIGLSPPRPPTIALFGPTGVGKTEIARALAAELFPPGAMTRIDMSELSEPHGVARLLGAPPGYVGHEHGGQLTEAVRRRPHQLVLLDEIEKAHPDVLLALLPLLDEGRLTDGRGLTVDFRHVVVVMTSNLGAAAAGNGSPGRIGFGSRGARSELDADAVLRAVRASLPPELWNRIDEPLVLGPLSQPEIREIARRMLDGISEALRAAHGLTLRVQPSALDALVRAGGFDAALGARPMRRTIGRLVESPLASGLLEGRWRHGDVVVARGDGDRVLLEYASGGSEAAA